MYPPLESDLLRIFVTVADAGNVTHAADRLGRTQSAVSMQVRKLEESVGVVLFERGPRGVALTVEGRRLLPYAKRIVGLVDETTAAMRTLPLDGPVRVGIPEEYNQTVLPNALAAFAEAHPGAEVTVFCGYTAQQMEALEADELDLALSRTASPIPAIRAAACARRLRAGFPLLRSPAATSRRAREN